MKASSPQVDPPSLSRETRSNAPPWKRNSIKWPRDAKCVVAITVDLDGPSIEAGEGKAPFGVHSTGRYAIRRGMRRYLAMFEKYGIPATFFVPGYDAQLDPDLVRDASEQGHEIASHGFVHEGHDMSRAEEERRLRLTHTILSDILGRPPMGWRAPDGRKSRFTMEILSDLGYEYDSSDKDSDCPYQLRIPGKQRPIVEIPNTTSILSDYRYNVARIPAAEMSRQWCAEFESVYSSGGFFILTCHPRAGFGSGTPSRSRAVEDLLRLATARSDVAFVRLEQIAEWVRDNQPYFEELSL